MKRQSLGILALACVTALAATACGTGEGSDADLPNVGPGPTSSTGGMKGDLDPTGSGSSCSCEAGPQGEPGPAGPQGPQGAQGDPGQDGQDGLDGEGCTVGLAGSNQVAITCGNTEQILTAVAGPKGDKGDTGATGTQGIQGVAGTPGAKGADGKDGIVSEDMVYQVYDDGTPPAASGVVAYCDVGDFVLTGGCKTASGSLDANVPWFESASSRWAWTCSSSSSAAHVETFLLCIDADGNHQ